MSNMQYWTLQVSGLILFLLGCWTAQTSFTVHGGLTAQSVNALLTKWVMAVIIYIIAVSARRRKA